MKNAQRVNFAEMYFFTASLLHGLIIYTGLNTFYLHFIFYLFLSSLPLILNRDQKYYYFYFLPHFFFDKFLFSFSLWFIPLLLPLTFNEFTLQKWRFVQNFFIQKWVHAKVTHFILTCIPSFYDLTRSKCCTLKWYYYKNKLLSFFMCFFLICLIFNTQSFI